MTCGCKFYDVGEPYICPQHSHPRESHVPDEVKDAWEKAHDVFCPRGQFCSTHLKPGHRHFLDQMSTTT